MNIWFNLEFFNLRPKLFDWCNLFIISQFTESTNFSIDLFNLLISHPSLTGIISVSFDQLSYLWFRAWPFVPRIIQHRLKRAVLQAISLNLSSCISNVFFIYLSLLNQQVWVLSLHVMPLKLLLYLLELILSDASRPVIKCRGVIKSLVVLD